MLGKVATGLGGALAALGEYPPGSEDSAVADLVDRLSDERAAPDARADAAERLRDLLEDSEKAQLALGASSALATLVDVLRRSGDNLAVVKPVLECLAVALAQAPAPATPAGAARTASQPSPGAINAELFARLDGSLALVLGLLAPDAPGGVAADFGARYYAARALTAVAVANPGRAVAAVLAAPAGVGRVMDLVADAHDAVRNEALVLALALARSSPDVQQVAVLEGGFERLLNMVGAEGGVDGGPAVQDAADLLAALVGGHAANATQFREAGHLRRLLPLIRQVDPVKKPSPQQAANLGAVLGVMHALVGPPPAPSGQPGRGPAGDAAALAAARRANQDALVAAGGVPTLISLCLDNGGMPDEGVRLRAMATLGALVAGCPAAQAALGGASISVVGRALPVVQALLRTALRAPTPAERVAGDSVLAGLCLNNVEGQAALAASISPVEKGRVPATFGQELVRGLLNDDPTLSVPSARVLGHLLRGCPAVKERLLAQMVEAHPQLGGPERLLLPTLVGRVRAYFETMGVGEDGSKSLPHAIAAACVLAGWLIDCPSAVSALQGVPGAMQGIIAAVAHGTPACDEAAMGLVAVLLGECMLFGQEPAASTVRDAITSQVGLAKYFTRLAGLRSLPAFSEAGTGLTDTVTPATAALDDDLRSFVAGFESLFQTRLMSSGGGGAGTAPQSPQQQQPFVPAPPAAAAPLAAPAVPPPPALTTEDAATFFEAAGPPAPPANGATPPAFAPPPPPAVPVTATGHVDVSALQRRCADLEAQAADARALADKLQRDLQDLSGAYATLEAHAADLEGQLVAGGAPSAPAAPSVDESTIQARIDAAVAAAQQEADDNLNDLLVCLGQEERKVEVLRSKLVEMGVDADGLVAAAGVTGE